MQCTLHHLVGDGVEDTASPGAFSPRTYSLSNSDGHILPLELRYRISWIVFYSLSCCWNSISNSHKLRKRGLFWPTILEVLVHSHLAPEQAWSGRRACQGGKMLTSWRRAEGRAREGDSPFQATLPKTGFFPSGPTSFSYRGPMIQLPFKSPIYEHLKDWREIQILNTVALVKMHYMALSGRSP